MNKPTILSRLFSWLDSMFGPATHEDVGWLWSGICDQCSTYAELDEVDGKNICRPCAAQPNQQSELMKYRITPWKDRNGDHIAYGIDLASMDVNPTQWRALRLSIYGSSRLIVYHHRERAEAVMLSLPSDLQKQNLCAESLEPGLVSRALISDYHPQLREGEPKHAELSDRLLDDLADQIFNYLEIDIKDRKGLKWEWDRISSQVMNEELRPEWKSIIKREVRVINRDMPAVSDRDKLAATLADITEAVNQSEANGDLGDKLRKTIRYLISRP